MRNARETVRAFYAAVARRDLAAARACLDEDLKFQGVFEFYSNADAYIGAWSRLLDITVALDVQIIIAEGNDAAIFFEITTREIAGKTHESAITATTLMAQWHHVVEGRIVKSRSAFDGWLFAPVLAQRRAE
jgi:ketosteroid isomerase-like protein